MRRFFFFYYTYLKLVYLMHAIKESAQVEWNMTLTKIDTAFEHICKLRSGIDLFILLLIKIFVMEILFYSKI